jgi:hypothetical protein
MHPSWAFATNVAQPAPAAWPTRRAEREREPMGMVSTAKFPPSPTRLGLDGAPQRVPGVRVPRLGRRIATLRVTPSRDGRGG